MKRCLIALLAAVIVLAAANIAGAAEKGVVKGTVITACPQGKELKLKTDCGREITFGVVQDAREQVKALKAGDRVEVSYTKCPKSDRLMATSVKKLCDVKKDEDKDKDKDKNKGHCSGCKENHCPGCKAKDCAGYNKNCPQGHCQSCKKKKSCPGAKKSHGKKRRCPGIKDKGRHKGHCPSCKKKQCPGTKEKKKDDGPRKGHCPSCKDDKCTGPKNSGCCPKKDCPCGKKKGHCHPCKEKNCHGPKKDDKKPCPGKKKKP